MRSIKKFHFSFQTKQLKTKKSKSESENKAFQKALIDELHKTKRRAFRGDVALKLRFEIAQDTPPMIHKLPKYYIDLLENIHPDLSQYCSQKLRNSKKLLLKDDRQIKLLVVSYHVSDIANQSSITLTVDSMSNFYKDLSLVQRIIRNDFEDDENEDRWHRNNFEYKEEYDYLEEENRNEAMDNLEDTLKNKEKYVSLYGGEDKYQAILENEKMRVQEYFLKSNSLSLRNWLDLYSRKINKQSTNKFIKMFEEVNQDLGFRDFILSRFMTSELPPLPTEKGGGENFREETEKALKNFYKSNTILNPLLHPVKVTLILVPPKQQGKDLDNLALKVLPILHEVLNPPSLEKIFNRAKFSRETKSKFNGLHKSMVNEYCVAEIPRADGDAENGLVRILIESGFSFFEDIHRKKDDLIRSWQETIND